MWSLAQFLDYQLEEMYKHAMEPTYDRFELANDIRKLRNSLMKPEKTVVDGDGEVVSSTRIYEIEKKNDSSRLQQGIQGKYGFLLYNSSIL